MTGSRPPGASVVRLPKIVTADDSPAAIVLTGLDPDGLRVRRPRWWGEVLVIVWLCWVYDAINNLAPLRVAVADAHARQLFDIERLMRIDPELSLDRWLSHQPTLGLIISDYYDNAHFVVTLALVGYLWWKAPALYRPLRTGLVLINVIGMAVFWLYPTAPPRLFEPSVFNDVVASSHAFGSWHSGSLASAANQLAAMPSLHLGWACWSGLAGWRLLKGRPWAALVWVYPAVTAVAVLATGNHFVLDAVAGVITFAAATVVADHWQSWWTTLQAVGAVRLRTGRSGPAQQQSLPGVDQFQAVAEAVVDVTSAHTRPFIGPPHLDPGRGEAIEQSVEGVDDQSGVGLTGG